MAAALGSLFSDRFPMCSSSIVFSVRVIVLVCLAYCFVSQSHEILRELLDDPFPPGRLQSWSPVGRPISYSAFVLQGSSRCWWACCWPPSPLPSPSSHGRLQGALFLTALSSFRDRVGAGGLAGAAGGGAARQERDQRRGGRAARQDDGLRLRADDQGRAGRGRRRHPGGSSRCARRPESKNVKVKVNKPKHKCINELGPVFQSLIMLTLLLPSSKRIFSQPIKEKCISDVVRIDSIITLSK